MWTQFYDMSSGGSEKLGACTIWIEAGEDEACSLFEAIFERDPHNVTCSCCGPDYSVYEYETLEAKEGDWTVSADDIARFRSGHLLTANIRGKAAQR